MLHRNTAPFSRAHRQSAGPSRGASYSRSSRHLPYTSTSCPLASVLRQETGCRLDSFQHLRQPYSSDSRITLGSRPSSQTIGQRFRRPERGGQSAKNLLFKTKYVVPKQDSDKLSLVVDLSRLNKFIEVRHFRMLHQELKMVIKTCKAMGFTFNLPKSQLVPTQQLPRLGMLGDTQIQTDAAIRVFQTKEFQREDSAGCSLMEIATLVPTTSVMVSISSTPQSPGPVGERNEILRNIL
ncbi:hypothetical protein Pcinc_021432 [Petrolisthes cinctipes]|uniref:Reverse transcriptase n=1 Tax=Petrolisthes cinctipes TaxID=88211 RepID=A0AAE1FH03_PETCI|nr:hypothetical protein Pcinc_021432 [Petrolisthes cinctipes]